MEATIKPQKVPVYIEEEMREFKKEFDANGCVIALHNGTSEVGRRPPKIGFWARDIAAARQAHLQECLAGSSGAGRATVGVTEDPA